MKKIVLTVIAMLSLTTMNAENENTTAQQGVEAYDMTVNIRRLAVTLGLTVDQMEAVEDIHRNFQNEMMLAAYAERDERPQMVDKAVSKDLRYMRYVLNQKQYRRYQLLLQTTLVNRGLK